MSNYHPATYILIGGLKEIGTTKAHEILYEWDQARNRLDNLNKTSDVAKEQNSATKIGRLKRKIEKLKKQRDHYKERHDHYAKVLEMQPYLERRYEDYTERVKREELNRQNAKTVIEQSKLIEMLMKENEQLRKNSVDVSKV
jgi:hypothetical protein